MFVHLKIMKYLLAMEFSETNFENAINLGQRAVQNAAAVRVQFTCRQSSSSRGLFRCDVCSCGNSPPWPSPLSVFSAP